jgi:hypothetical protein
MTSQVVMFRKKIKHTHMLIMIILQTLKNIILVFKRPNCICTNGHVFLSYSQGLVQN